MSTNMTTKKQPKVAPPQPTEPVMPQPDPQYAAPQPVEPAPVAPVTPVAPVAQPVQPQQPYQQQYGPDQAVQQPMQYAQPQYAQPQYVIMQQSLKGVGGWLIFFMVIFGMAALGYIMTFFVSMMTLSSASSIVSLIFAPILAGGYITTIIMIAMQKRLGRLFSWITLSVSALYTVINSIVAYAIVGETVRRIDEYSYYSSQISHAVDRSLPLLIGSILVSIVAHGLFALYFILSKRVKETLVN